MTLKKYFYPVVLIMMVVAAASCSKGNSDVLPAADSTSTLDVINAVTDIRAVDFYLNGTRQNTSSAIYLFNASGYVTLPKGQQQYQFKSDTDRSVLADISLNLASTKSSYTLILAGQQSSKSLTPIFITDVFPTDASTQSRVRFVQAAPGTEVYDVAVGDTLSFKNNAFKAATGFQLVGAGKKIVKVMLSGTTTAIATDTIIIQKSTFYTLYTHGLLSGTGNNKLGVSVNLSR